MGVQQSRRSKSRTRRKRAAWLSTDKPNVMECPQCHSVKLPHRLCPECGYYNGREVIAKDDQAALDKVKKNKLSN
jgi:large subunit ribosomal protein L32